MHIGLSIISSTILHVFQELLCDTNTPKTWDQVDQVDQVNQVDQVSTLPKMPRYAYIIYNLNNLNSPKGFLKVALLHGLQLHRILGLAEGDDVWCRRRAVSLIRPERALLQHQPTVTLSISFIFFIGLQMFVMVCRVSSLVQKASQGFKVFGT